MSFLELWEELEYSPESPISWQQMAYVERLAMNSTMSKDDVLDTLNKAQHMTQQEADGLIKLLQLSQMNPEEIGISNQTVNVESVRERVFRDDFRER